MKASTAAERAIQKNLEILKANGIDFSDGMEEMKKKLLAAGAEHVQSKSEALEATIKSVLKPGSFTYRQCKRCGETFGADYRSVAFCSDHCRIEYLRTVSGIEWSSGKTPIERWGGEPPLIIPPSVLKVMVPYAKRILEAVETSVTGEMGSEISLLPAEPLPYYVQLEFDFSGDSEPEPDQSPTKDLPVAILPPLLGKPKAFVMPGTVSPAPVV